MEDLKAQVIDSLKRMKEGASEEDVYVLDEIIKDVNYSSHDKYGILLDAGAVGSDFSFLLPDRYLYLIESEPGASPIGRKLREALKTRNEACIQIKNLLQEIHKEFERCRTKKKEIFEKLSTEEGFVCDRIGGVFSVMLRVSLKRKASKTPIRKRKKSVE